MSWLLLRGLAREARHWLSFPETLERALPGQTVHVLDLPGAGTENRRDSPTSIEGIAEDLRARWLALRDAHPGPWSLLGMSLGGMVAMAWCAAHPEDFERVVLVSTSAGDLSAPWRRFALGILPDAVRALTETDPVLREGRMLAISSRRADATVAGTWARFAVDRPMRRANVLRQLHAGRRFRAPSSLPVPALVVAGLGDRLADLSCARLLASHFGARLEVHPDAGHEIALDAPEWLAERIQRFAGASAPAEVDGVRRDLPSGATLPLVLTPGGADTRSLGALTRHKEVHHAELEAQLLSHGALLFRGFDVTDAASFEAVARAMGPTLGNQYLGTSPRNALTEFTFSASELPAHYPIPQHCEMSFVRKPPRRIFFSCLVPSSGAGGETPLADFRAVLRDLDPEVRRKFETRGVRSVRNYAGPEGGGRFDLWKLKRWDEMFQTQDRAEVERLSRENGFQATWRPGGMLRLVNVQPAVKRHPVSGEPVWFNHAQVFHPSAVPAEYQRIASRQGELRYGALSLLASALVLARSGASDPDDQAMHCTYGDGTPISAPEMELVRDAIWKNMVFFKWRAGDVLVLDNDSVSHGRMPFRGPRSVAVAWA